MKYLNIFIAFFIMTGLTSCLFEEKDLFDKPYNERVEEDMQQAESVLEGAENGWLMKYFPHPSQDYGGYNMFFKFKDGKVTIASEMAEASATSTSLYSIGQESGPTLTVDSRNELLNWFIHPRNEDGLGSTHAGLQGDFLWKIMSASPEEVVLQGVKTGNRYLLTPLAADADWTTEMQTYKDAAAAGEHRSYRCILNGTEELDVEVTRDGYFQYKNWTITGRLGEEETFVNVNIPYIFTKEGIELYEPVEIGGITVKYLKSEPENYRYVNEDASFVIEVPRPVISENRLEIKVSMTYVSIMQINVTPTVLEDEYVVRAFLASEIENMTDEEIQKMVCRDLREIDFMKGKKMMSIQRAYPECGYVIVAFGADRASYTATTPLFRLDYTTPAINPSYITSVKDWIGTWKVTSASSELSGKPQTFNISVRPRNNAQVFISGWGHTAIRDEFEFLASWLKVDGKEVLRILPTQEEELEDQQKYLNNLNMQVYVNGKRRLIRCRYQDLDNPASFAQFGTSKWMFEISQGDVPGTASVVGNKGKSAKGVNYQIASLDVWEEHANGSGYYYPGAYDGYTERDFAIGPYVMEKISDDYNRPPKAGETNNL